MAARRGEATSATDLLTEVLDLGEWVFLLITVGAVAIILGYASDSTAAVVVGIIIIVLAIMFGAWALLARGTGGPSPYTAGYPPSEPMRTPAFNDPSHPSHPPQQPYTHQFNPSLPGAGPRTPPPPYAIPPPQGTTHPQSPSNPSFPTYPSYSDPWSNEETYAFGPPYSRPEPPTMRQPVRCTNCGGKVFFGRAFCPNCGAKVYEDSFESMLEKVR